MLRLVLVFVWSLTLMTIAAAAAMPTLADLILANVKPAEVKAIAVYRRDPLQESPVRITPRTITRDYSDMAEVRRQDTSGFNDLMEALGSRALGSCSHHVSEVTWAVLFEAGDGTVLGRLDLDESGRCALIDGKAYFVERDVIQQLKRQFSFMNF